MSYEVCVGCGRGRNPASPLVWYTAMHGSICGACYKDQPARAPVSEPELIIVRCPVCRGCVEQTACESCLGYGSVRIEANALPVYTPKATRPAGPLTETNEEGCGR